MDEAVYILLTYQTDVPRAQQVWSALKDSFRDWDRLLAAEHGQLEEMLKPAGFQSSRARLIHLLLAAVRARFGAFSLAALTALDDEAAEAELRRLPGLDIKGARCILLYSLGRRVLPVDSNTFRFMHRYGVLDHGSRYRRRSTHDEIQQLVAPSNRYSLHVNLVAHGRQTCLPRTPRCGECVVRRTCATARRANHA